METIKLLSYAFGGKTFGRLFLATIWSLFAMWFVYHIITSEIPKDSLRFVDNFNGFIMGTIVAGILGYYFGSSQSSTDKDVPKDKAPDVVKTTSVIESTTENKP